MRTVIGIDPGSAKVGLAVVRKNNHGTHIEERDVVEVNSLVERLRTALDSHDPEMFVVGNGTNAKQIIDLLRQGFPAMPILVVDERDTSIRAREKYWEYTPRRGWRRLLPSSLLVPPVPIDDFSAAILAESALNIE